MILSSTTENRIELSSEQTMNHFIKCNSFIIDKLIASDDVTQLRNTVLFVVDR